jgi:UDP-N-acetylglucosamine 3-dehydrogenase
LTVKIGVIGAGAIAQEAHLPAYSKLPDVEIVGIADVNEKTARRVAKKYHCKAYSDYTKLLGEDELDAISICTPPFARLEMIKAASEKGVGILCEKPLAESYLKAAEINKVVEDSNVQFMMGFTLRFDNWYKEAQQKVSEGKLGDVVFLRGVYADTFPQYSWILNKEMRGGVMMDKGSHAIDMATWLLGPPKEVQSITFNKREMAIDENAFLVMKHDTAYSQLTFSFGVNKRMERLEIYGTACNFIIDQELLTTFFLPSSDNAIFHLTKVYKNAAKQLLCSKGIINQPTSHFQELEYFVNCIKTGEKPTPNHSDGLTNMAIIDASYRSAMNNGQPTTVNYAK